MKLLKKKSSFYLGSIYYVACVLLIIIFSAFNIFEALQIPFLSNFSSFKIIILFLMCFAFIFIFAKRCIIDKTVAFPFVVALIVSLFLFSTTLLNISDATFSLKDYFTTTIWAILFIGFLYSFCKPIESKIITIFSLMYILVFGFLYIVFANRIKTSLSVNSIYYIIFLFLFCFTGIRHTWIKIIISLFVTCVCISSLKTSIWILVVVAWIIYFLLFFKKRNIKIYKIASWILTIFILTVIIVFLTLILSGNLSLDKINDFTSDRINIGLKAINSFFGNNFNMRRFLFGLGHSGVLKSIGISAHNDFIEVFCDYGLVGFTILFASVFYVFKTVLKDKNNLINYVFLFIFLLTLLSSHLLFIAKYYYIVVLAIFLYTSKGQNYASGIIERNYLLIEI